MRDWWSKLQNREQGLIIISMSIVAVAMIYSLVWSPLLSNRDHQRLQVEDNYVLLEWMQSKADYISRFRLAYPNRVKSDNTQSLLAAVDSRASQLGLRNAINKIEPNGDDEVILSMDRIGFDALMVMLGDLEISNQISADQVTITQLEKSGSVRAKIILVKN